MYNWYKIINVAEFESLGLTSRELELELEDIGVKDILITRGNYLGILYEGIFLVPNIDGHNPFEKDGHAAYVDSEYNLWLGIAVPDES